MSSVHRGTSRSVLPLVAIRRFKRKVCIYTCSTHAHRTLGSHISEFFKHKLPEARGRSAICVVSDDYR